MKESNPIINYLMFSFCVFLGYHMLGFELIVVTMLAVIMFNVIESRGEIT